MAGTPKRKIARAFQFDSISKRRESRSKRSRAREGSYSVIPRPWQGTDRWFRRVRKSKTQAAGFSAFRDPGVRAISRHPIRRPATTGTVMLNYGLARVRRVVPLSQKCKSKGKRAQSRSKDQRQGGVCGKRRERYISAVRHTRGARCSDGRTWNSVLPYTPIYIYVYI